MDILFWIFIFGYNPILNFIVQVALAFAFGSSFSWFSLSFAIHQTLRTFFVFLAFPYFLALQDVASSPSIFSAPILELPIS